MLLGLCAVIVQSSMVIVARHFLDVHHERPLSDISRMITVTYVIFTGLTFLSTLLAPSPLQGIFSLFFLAFLALFLYLDAASRCLPRCFTLAFGLTGAIFRFFLYQETVLLALLTALIIFGVLWGLQTFAYRRDGHAQFGLGDVYLTAGLGMWFSFQLFSVSSVVPLFQGKFFCWQEDYAIRCSGKKTSLIVQRRFYVEWQLLRCFCQQRSKIIYF